MNRYGLTQLEKLAIGVAIMAVVAVLIPLYRQLVDIKRTADCLSNLKDIATAINLYQIDYGNTLPLAYYAHPDGSPQTDSAGRPLTWVVCISSYMKRDLQRALKCPADPTGGSTIISHPRESGKTLRLSYGFYAPLSAVRLEDLPNPGLNVLIADSLAGGLLGSLNPNPLVGGNDGFALTFDDARFKPSPNSKYVVRLAVWRRREQDGWEPENLRSFHGKGVNVLHADGHVSTRAPSIMFLQRDAQGKLE
ncbi:MAG: H-X9-DG-CTERM domain-containing protein, partial [Fimbriimonadales bacterium]